MITFLTFAILSQFQPVEFDPITVDDYAKLCQTAKEGAVKQATEQLAREMELIAPSNPRNAVERRRATLGKKKAAERGKEGAKEILAYLNDESQIHEVPLYVSRLSIGDIGILTTDGRVMHGKVSPTPIRVNQVLDKKTFSFNVGDQTIIVRNVDTSEFVDDQVISLPYVMVVSGKYAYTTVLNARRTVLAIEPWKHDAEWDNRKEKLVEDAKAKAEKDSEEKPTKTKSKK